MEVRLQRRFDLPVTPEQAWDLLSDIPAAASCMPGVTISGREGDRVWLGGMRARIGPATMDFKGRVEIQSLEPAEHRVHMTGKGGDTAGSSAVMDLRAHIAPAAVPGSCTLVSDATVAVSGRLAQFGSRLLLPVADTLLRNFVARFSQEAALRAVQATVRGPSQQEPTTAAAGTQDRPEPAPAAPALDAIAILWSSVRRWWSGRFGAPKGGGPPPAA